MYQIYCDGSCKNNGGKNPKAAWAYIMYEVTPEYKSEVKRDYGIIENGTNNIAEMTAMINALEYWYANYGDTVIVHTDSAYIANAYKGHWIENWKKNGWKTAQRTPVKNKELWKRLDKFFSNQRNVIIDKVEGHAGIPDNELVDRLAQNAWEELNEQS